MDEKKRKPISEENAYSRMARICSQKECCSFDIEQKMKRLQLSEEAINRILRTLQKQKFIDNRRFARSFINDKLNLGKWGRSKIEFALRQKNISPEIINEEFSEIPIEALTESLKPLLKKKLQTVTGKSEYEKRSKVIRFGLSRGFSMRSILNCLEEIPEGYENCF